VLVVKKSGEPPQNQSKISLAFEIWREEMGRGFYLVSGQLTRHVL